MPELIAGIPDIARRACKIIEDFESGFEESSESDSDAGSEEEESGDVHPFWEVPFAELEIVMDFLPAVPNDSVGILATYLGRGTLCARTVVRAVRNLRRLNALGEEATQRLGAIEAQRKAQIEAALEKAGVRGFGGAWPVSEAVYNYVRDPERSLDEVIECERQRWQEMEEKRVTKQAAQKPETTKRSAEQLEAREAERHARCEREEAAERARRTS